MDRFKINIIFFVIKYGSNRIIPLAVLHVDLLAAGMRYLGEKAYYFGANETVEFVFELKFKHLTIPLNLQAISSKQKKLLPDANFLVKTRLLSSQESFHLIFSPSFSSHS